MQLISCRAFYLFNQLWFAIALGVFLSKLILVRNISTRSHWYLLLSLSDLRDAFMFSKHQRSSPLSTFSRYGMRYWVVVIIQSAFWTTYIRCHDSRGDITGSDDQEVTVYTISAPRNKQCFSWINKITSLSTQTLGHVCQPHSVQYSKCTITCNCPGSMPSGNLPLSKRMWQ